MPLIDIYYAAGTLDAEAAQVLADRIATLAREEEGYAGSRFAASVTWVYLHALPDTAITRSGAVPKAPLWRVEISTPTGSLDAEGRARLGEAVAGEIIQFEGLDWTPAEGARVWTLFRDVDPGFWFAGAVAADVRTIRAVVAREREAAA